MLSEACRLRDHIRLSHWSSFTYMQRRALCFHVGLHLYFHFFVVLFLYLHLYVGGYYE